MVECGFQGFQPASSLAQHCPGMAGPQTALINFKPCWGVTQSCCQHGSLKWAFALSCHMQAYAYAADGITKGHIFVLDTVQSRASAQDGSQQLSCEHTDESPVEVQRTITTFCFSFNASALDAAIKFHYIDVQPVMQLRGYGASCCHLGCHLLKYRSGQRLSERLSDLDRVPERHQLTSGTGSPFSKIVTAERMLKKASPDWKEAAPSIAPGLPAYSEP